jgi:hypothetical protein
MNTAKAAKTSRRRTRDRGAILMVVLIVIIALLGLGMTGLFLTSGSIQMNSNINLRNQALVVAEAGIERARGILNNPLLSPNVPAMLAPATTNPADEPITTQDECQGERRGALLRDNGVPLIDVNYPSVNRSDLPGTGGTPAVSATMGQYTVYVRQDTRDCRMGNYTCELAPGIDGGIEACATTPALSPNGAIVVRSEGVATDGKTRVVLEVTMSPALGVGLGGGVPLSSLCASGANGCDGNDSVPPGIVVVGHTPSEGGAAGSGEGGSSGTAGAAGSGAGGAGASTTGSLPSSAGGGGGTSSTLPGAGGAGGGAGGGTGCRSEHCLRIATMGVWGVWNEYVTTSANDSGSDVFREWLDEHNAGCKPVGSITTWGSVKPITAEDLAPYSVLILLDLYHSNADRWGCLRNWNCCQNQRCYSATGVSAACGAGATPYTVTGSTVTTTSTSTTAISGCTAPNTTSYKLGNAPQITEAEVDVIEAWVRSGGGLVTTAGYYYNNPEYGNVNRILRRFNLKYVSYDNDQPGRKPGPLEGINGWGTDLCGGTGTCPGGDDWNNTSPPFNYVKPVTRLQIRTGAPQDIINYTSAPDVNPQRAMEVKCERVINTATPGCGLPIAQCIDPSISRTYPSSWRYNAPWKLSHIVDGLQPGNGRVVTWGDEWMTYNTVWNTGAACGSGYLYHAAAFWENVLRWIGKCTL